MLKQKQPVTSNDLVAVLAKDLSIPFLLSRRPAFPLSFIEKAISQGLPVNAVDKNLDETLLMYAARTNNLKLAQLLVDKSATIDQTNVRDNQTQGENALLIACKFGNFEIVDFLMSRGGQIAATDKNGASAMHLVVKEGNHDSICRLVERNLPMNLKDSRGKAPIHYAAESGDLSTVVRLIQLGADVNAVDNSGRTPAAYAEDNNHYEVLDQLVAIGGKNMRTKTVQRDAGKKKSLADLSISSLNPQFKEFLSAADRTLFNLQKTQDMLEDHALEQTQ